MNNETCYEKLATSTGRCGNTACKFFCEKMGKQCSIIEMKGNKDFLTLQKMSDILKLSRMRVCQIERSAVIKISTDLSIRGFEDLPFASIKDGL